MTEMLVTMKPRYNSEKWYIEDKAKDTGKSRFCHKIKVCPCAETCDQAQFKAAKLWSWEDEETVREYLMAHLCWGKCHKLSLAEAEVFAMEAVVDCDIETWDDRESERLKWAADQEKARAKKEAAGAAWEQPADAGDLGLQECKGDQAKSGGKHWHPNNYDWNHQRNNNNNNNNNNWHKGDKGKGGKGKGGKGKGKDKDKEGSFAEAVENVAQLS